MENKTSNAIRRATRIRHRRTNMMKNTRRNTTTTSYNPLMAPLITDREYCEEIIFELLVLLKLLPSIKLLERTDMYSRLGPEEEDDENTGTTALDEEAELSITATLY